MKTLYDILELSRQASPEAVDASYLRLVRHCRARSDDPGADAAELALRTDALERAHAVLADPQSRRAYDEELNGRQALRVRPSGARPHGARPGLRRYLQAPWVWGLILVVVILAVGYPIIAHRAEAPASSEPASQSRIRQLEHEMDLQARQFALENAYLRRQLDVAQREQERLDRELAYRAEATDRALNMQERVVETQLRETNAERTHRTELDAEESLSRRVADLNRATEAVRDLNAARLGISAQQYERLREEQSGW